MVLHKRFKCLVLMLFLGSEVMTVRQGISPLDVMMGGAVDLPLSFGQQEMIQEMTRLKRPGEKYNGLIYETAKQYAVEPALIKAIMEAESDFDPWSVSRAGAMGLMQLMPETAFLVGVHNVFDPQENIRGGVVFFKDLLDVFRGDITLALAAYNAGPGNVKKYKGIPPFEETQKYVQKVLLRYEFYKSADFNEKV